MQSECRRREDVGRLWADCRFRLSIQTWELAGWGTGWLQTGWPAIETTREHNVDPGRRFAPPLGVGTTAVDAAFHSSTFPRKPPGRGRQRAARAERKDGSNTIRPNSPRVATPPRLPPPLLVYHTLSTRRVARASQFQPHSQNDSCPAAVQTRRLQHRLAPLSRRISRHSTTTYHIDSSSHNSVVYIE